MARTNTANKKVAFTHEGGRAFAHMTPTQINGWSENVLSFMREIEA